MAKVSSILTYLLIFLCMVYYSCASDFSIRFTPMQFDFDTLKYCKQSLHEVVDNAQSVMHVCVLLARCEMSLIEIVLRIYNLDEQLKYNFYVYKYFVEHHGFVCTDEIRREFPCLSYLLLRWEQDLKNEELPPLR